MDKISSLIFVILGIALFTLTQSTIKVTGSSFTLSPTFFPIFSSLLLVFFGVLLGIIAYKKKSSMATKDPTYSTNKMQVKNFNFYLIVLTVIGYVILLDIIGFIYSSIIVSIALMFLFGERNRMYILISSVVFNLVCYIIFNKGFLIPLPWSHFYYIMKIEETVYLFLIDVKNKKCTDLNIALIEIKEITYLLCLGNGAIDY